MDEDISYRPLIDDMEWSHSRITAYESCPYRFYLRYIKFPRDKYEGKEHFFSSYGKFMHELIRLYRTGEKTKEQLIVEYLSKFRETITAPAPNAKVFSTYFADGLMYLQNMEPSENEIISTETKLRFDFRGKRFVGYIDSLERKPDGSLVIVDDKSRNLKPRSKRSKPTKTDIELDEYLRQLYMYSLFLIDEFGEMPGSLCFNCFRTQTMIEEKFWLDELEDTLEWIVVRTREIINTSEFEPDLEWYKCKYICEMQDVCSYFEIMEDTNWR